MGTIVRYLVIPLLFSSGPRLLHWYISFCGFIGVNSLKLFYFCLLLKIKSDDFVLAERFIAVILNHIMHIVWIGYFYCLLSGQNLWTTWRRERKEVSKKVISSSFGSVSELFQAVCSVRSIYSHRKMLKKETPFIRKSLSSSQWLICLFYRIWTLYLSFNAEV